MLLRQRFKPFKWKINKRGFSILEMLVVIVVIGIIANLAVLRYLQTQNRARIAAATYDIFLLKKSLGMYEAFYGFYPPWDRDALENLLKDLIDSDGRSLMELSKGNNFADFSYQSKLNGQSYTLIVVALDNNRTEIQADPARTWIVREPPRTGAAPTPPPGTPPSQDSPGRRLEHEVRAQENP